MAHLLSVDGVHERAATIGSRALASLRQLPNMDDTIRSDFAAALFTVAGERWEVGDLIEALNTSDECVHQYRQLSHMLQVNLFPQLGAALTQQGGLLSASGQHEGAMEAATQAVAAYRSATEADESQVANYGGALTNLGALAMRAASPYYALFALNRAVDTYEQLSSEQVRLPLSVALAERATVWEKEGNIVKARHDLLRSAEILSHCEPTPWQELMLNRVRTRISALPNT